MVSGWREMWNVLDRPRNTNCGRSGRTRATSWLELGNMWVEWIGWVELGYKPKEEERRRTVTKSHLEPPRQQCSAVYAPENQFSYIQWI